MASYLRQNTVAKTLVAISLALPLISQAAIDIQFDFTYDTGFLTGENAGRQAVFEQVASELEARLINESFGALAPSGQNTLQLRFDNPGNSGTDVILNNPNIAANTLKVYVGGSDLSASGQLGFANYGTSYGGFTNWFNAVEARNSTTNYEPLGGGITFNSATNWYFGTDESGLGFSQYDLYTVAMHEMIHMLGFGQSDAFTADSSGGQFVGSNVQALVGGPVALNAAGDHFAQSTSYLGDTSIMVPALVNGQRRSASELEFAVLRDIGYNITAVPEPATWALSLLGLVGIFAASRRKMAV